MNKKLIRLTESDLHNIVKKTVNKIIRETTGYISHDGNGMVGGSYGSRKLSATFYLYNYIDNALSDAGAFESEDGDKINEYINLCDSKGIFNIKLTVVESYDHSVGIDYDIEIDAIDNNSIDRAEEALKQLPTKNPQFINAALKGLKDGVDRLESDNSVIGDIDINYGY